MRPSLLGSLAASLAFAACTSAPPPPPADAPPPAAPAKPASLPLSELVDRPAPIAAASLACEPHLTDVKQLTFGGENAEAYWSFGGKELTMQSRFGNMGCDRIVRFDADQGLPSLVPVSSGYGATTCSYFLPGDQEIIYASTHLGGDECPPKPDMSKGYVWALYDSYDIWKTDRDGNHPVRLTDAPGYDAEATVCAKDGSIIFTSTRDGDIELYRMDRDGKNVVRLTHTPGYDGGAFFNADCTKIVWRASRPKPGPEQDEFKSLLAQGLVRPTKLEIYVANADGSDPVQLTYIDSASFAPYFMPDGKRVIFSTNYGDPKGREFDLWMVNIDGSNLTRVTCAPGFDGFPMFSPDGTRMVFASNRATAPGQRDTNVFLAKWTDDVKVTEAPPLPGPAERIRADVDYLADPAREGRGLGTKGLEAAGAYVEARFKALGLAPAGTKGYRQPFDVTTQLAVLPATQLTVGGKAVDGVAPLGFSARGSFEGPIVNAGYGVVQGAVDDYRGLDVKGRIVVVRRFVPDAPEFSSTDAKRRFGDIRYKAWVAKERGAKALIVVDAPVATSTATPGPEAALPTTEPEGPGDAGILVAAVKREGFLAAMNAASAAGKAPPRAKLTVALRDEKTTAFNVVGRIPATGKPIGGPIVIGAHYDHLGYGGRHSLAPDKKDAHVGADDNGSGTAVILEIARQLAAAKDKLQRDVVVVAFSGEEAGVLGSSHFVRTPPKGIAPKDVMAMLNFDMVGRLRANALSVLGGESAAEWKDLVGAACAAARVECNTSGDGYGPSDHTPFYAANIPVLHFFTGAHNEYHKPSDTADRVNAGGAARIADIARDVTLALAARKERLTYKQLPSPAPRGDLRSFNASLGTVPNYVGPPNGQKGMLLDGVRPGGAADKAGLRRGDIIVKLGVHEIGGVEDLMYVLNASRPGETVTVTVLRDGQKVSSEVTFQESHGRR